MLKALLKPKEKKLLRIIVKYIGSYIILKAKKLSEVVFFSVYDKFLS